MTKKNTLLVLCVSSFISVIIVLSLYIISRKRDDIKNDFIRNYCPAKVSNPKKFDLKYPGYYIAGNTLNRLYLANYKTPLHIIETNYNLTDTIHLVPRIANTLKFRWKHARVSIDSPHVYITEGITPVLFAGTLDKLTLTPYMKNSEFFTYFLPISSSSMILISVQANPKENMILKQMNGQPPYFKKANGVLEKQVDGLFCTNGMLNYDKNTSTLVYLYHYRNEFICMDTSLTVLYKGNTIDTTSQAKIKVATIESEGSITLVSPQTTIVNKKSCVFNNRLFVQSALLADNEARTEVGKKAVIDTYSLSDGKYLFSFYIPAYKGEEITDFQVVNNLIIALYDRYLYTYRLDVKFGYNQL